jgi:tetrahydromethanopterin S-methyltransferase subunit G
MKKSPQKKNIKQLDDKPFTTGEAKRMFGGIQEHFDDNFKVINDRIGMMDEKFELKFTDVHQVLGEHTQLLGRLLIDVEEIKSGMREKVSLEQFNKLEKRLVSLESIVLGGKTMRPKGPR